MWRCQEKILDTFPFFCYDTQGDEMEKKIMQTYLYDFYGELLTEHQREIYEDFVLNDLSLGEIAQEKGISRQGVHDLIKRCDKLLLGYEEKLGLFQRFRTIKEKVAKIHQLTLEQGSQETIYCNIRKLSSEIIEEL